MTLHVDGIRLLEPLAELADAERQQSLWIEGLDGEIGSIEEAASRLFDDSGLEAALDAASEVPLFTAAIDGELRVLGSRLDSILRSAPDPRTLAGDESMAPGEGACGLSALQAGSFHRSGG